MHDIDKDLLTLYREVKAENPKLDEELISDFMYRMKDIAYNTLMEKKFGCHITNGTQFESAMKYLKDGTGSHVHPKWSYDDVIRIAKSYIDIDQEDFYDWDLATQANIFYYDYGNIESEPSRVIRLAISSLKDADYPFSAPDERAYHWWKAHEEKDKE